MLLPAALASLTRSDDPQSNPPVPQLTARIGHAAFVVITLVYLLNSMWQG